MNLRHLILTIVLALISPALIVVGQNRTILFSADSTDAVPYRIPAITQLEDGRILALCDYRPCGADIGFGRVDIYGRLSSSDRTQWDNHFVMAEGTGVPGALDCGFGDPAVVTDRETGEVLVLSVCGNTPYGAQTTTRQNPNRISLFRSVDNCATWEKWKEITEDVYTLFDESTHGPIQSCFVTSGKIFQSSTVKVGSHYRIYLALTARPNGNRVIFSDDFGKTWKPLGGKDALPVKHGDEAKCEEIPGGLVISSRARGGRYFNVFRYSDVASAEGVWDEPAYSSESVKGCYAKENACNGELLIIPALRTSDGVKVLLALQSVPLGPKRRNVGIYYKEIDGTETSEELASNWSGPYKVSDKPSAYSTMIQLKNGGIAFLYEESNKVQTNGYDIVYEEFSLSQITDGSYKEVLSKCSKKSYRKTFKRK